MHQARGDQIYFITGRTAGDKDGVTPVLQKAFNIKDMHPVEFMGGRKLPTKYNKTPGIIEHKVSIHYGDSDDDILAAKEAGIRGIRLMRAANVSGDGVVEIDIDLHGVRRDELAERLDRLRRSVQRIGRVVDPVGEARPDFLNPDRMKNGQVWTVICVPEDAIKEL